MKNPYKSKNSIKIFREETYLRSTGQLKNINFWSYFVTGIIIFGGAGIWYELCNVILNPHNSTHALSIAIIFYVTTLLGGICSQVLLDKTIREDEIKSGSWLIIVILYSLTAFLIFIHTSIPEVSFLALSITLSILTLLMAWFINTFNMGLSDHNNIDDSTGGDIILTPPTGSNITEDPLKSNFKDLEEY